MFADKIGFSPKLLFAGEFNPHAELQDDDLIIACQTHDPAAFAALYKRYIRFVYGTFYRLSKDQSNSYDDMVQDVFIRVWGSLGTLKNPRAFKTWLTRLIYNVFFDVLRKRRLTLSLDEPVSNDDGAISDHHEIADNRNLPDEQFERKETMRQICTAVRALPRQFQLAVVLREFDGLEYEQIAELTRSSVGTVKSRLARGRAKIQVRLKSMLA